MRDPNPKQGGHLGKRSGRLQEGQRRATGETPACAASPWHRLKADVWLPPNATARKALGAERGRDKTTADEPGCPGPGLLKRGREHRRIREAQGTGRVTAKGPGEGSRQGPEPRSARSVDKDRRRDSAGRTGTREATSLENAINGREQIDAHDTGNAAIPGRPVWL